MKKMYVISLCALVLFSCGKSKNGTELGQEVCDCSKKANGMDPNDPNRAKAQADCSVMQGKAWNKVKDDPEKADAFNKVLSVCADEQIKKSFGQ
ncbi:MAG: hypothetical protein JNM88_06380 [Chitinophagaceae bacterium]|nr:hypothetical protein [Chitinophagaceae bacterium]